MAARKRKPLRILSVKQQKKSILGVTRRKTAGTKNALDNPLALEWPVITLKDQEHITRLLQRSCRGLRKMKIRPPWNEVKKHRSGAERKAFLHKFREEFLGRQDAGALKHEQEAATARAHLVLGFNATMRALENDRIAAIAVKSNVSPPFLAKTFLPGCGTKCIPIVPIPDLDSLLRADDGLGLEHSCMSLGLRPAVRERSNRFNALYMKMCAALKIEEGEDETDDSDDDVESEKTMMEVEEEDGDNKKSDVKMLMDIECEINQKDIENDENRAEIRKKENEILEKEGGKHGEVTLNKDSIKQSKFRVLSTEEIQSYLLKRSQPNRREFIPGQQCDGMGFDKLAGNKNGMQILDSGAEFESDFIRLEAGKTEFSEGSKHKSNSGNAPQNHGNPAIPRFTQKQSENGSANVSKLNEKELHEGKACVSKFTQKGSDKRNTPKPAQKDPDRGSTNVPIVTQKDSNKKTANTDIDFNTMLFVDREGDESCRDAAALKMCDGKRIIETSLTNTEEAEGVVVERGDWERKGKNEEKNDDENNDVGNGQDVVSVHKDGGNRKTKKEGDGTKKKNVKRKAKACEYIPAQMKRFKGNPHRKSK